MSQTLLYIHNPIRPEILNAVQIYYKVLAQNSARHM